MSSGFLRSSPLRVSFSSFQVPASFASSAFVSSFFSSAAKDVAGGVYFVIGPEKQMALYESYLMDTEGKDTRLHRLYPRDFWMAAPAGAAQSQVVGR